MKVLRFSDFYDSVVTDIPDSAIFPEWDYKEIHERKFDFYNAKDTQLVILADSFGCNYYHPVDNRVTSDFGVRKWRFHYGIDVKLNTGDPVHASWDGVVRISRYSRSYGNVVVIRHDNGLETLYAHLSKRLVKTDSLVHAGEVIGLGGNTGRSYGSHLHFEVRYFDEAINPRDIIDFDNY
ncbi:MAG: metalloendopeptidase, partial [Marinilabiliales bacterium]